MVLLEFRLRRMGRCSTGRTTLHPLLLAFLVIVFCYAVCVQFFLLLVMLAFILLVLDTSANRLPKAWLPPWCSTNLLPESLPLTQDSCGARLPLWCVDARCMLLRSRLVTEDPVCYQL